MHELSLLASLMKKLDALSQEHRNAKIRGLKVKLGALSHISADHFREHFEEAARGTSAEGAKLEIACTDEIMDVFLESVEVEA